MAKMKAEVRKALSVWASFFSSLSENEEVSKAISERRAMLAYQGSKPRDRKLDGLQAVAGKLPALETFLRNACLAFTSAYANDGEIIRVNDAFGNEAFRFFISKRGKYAGMYGVSGKARAVIENVTPDAPYAWVQQGSKNYWFSPCWQGLYNYLETLKP